MDEHGKMISVMSQVEDITERQLAEAQLRERSVELEVANKELEAFSYSVSHDLRAPLRTLEGFSQIVTEDYGDKLDETGRDYLNRVTKASIQMSNLIDDMLKLSGIGRTDINRTELDLAEMARSIEEELRKNQPERNLEFIIASELADNGDISLLRMALTNLLENAWKYTGKCDNARIEFGAVQRDGAKTYFVKDNGVGFDMQYAGKLFQPFQRLHSERDYAGTGIGLAIVQRIIRRHGGKIWAESEKGKGATFYFTLS